MKILKISKNQIFSLIYDKESIQFTFVLFVLLLFGVTCQTIYPKLIEHYIDNLNLSQTYIKNLALIIIGAVILKNIVNYFTNVVSAKLYWVLTNNAKNIILSKILRSSFKNTQSISPGELTQTYENDIDAIMNYYSNVLLVVFINIFTIAGIILISIFSNLTLGLLLLLITIISYFILKTVNVIAAPFWEKQRKTAEEFFTYLSEIFDLVADLNLIISVVQ